MRNAHEPHDDFVERLQWQIGAELRRRHRTPAPAAAPLRSRLQIITAAAALVAVSMGIGGAVVVAAYQAQNNQQRDLLVSGYHRRAELAKERLAIVRQKLADGERRVQLGLMSHQDLLEDRTGLVELEAQIAILDVQAQEAQLSGREPIDGVSAPLVSGRDFVSERWRIEARVPAAALQFENVRWRETSRRFAVGLGGEDDVAEARARVDELQAATAAFETRLALRQRFLKKEVDAAEADLRVLESEAQLRQTLLRPKVEVARRQLGRLTKMWNVGLTTRVMVAEAQLKVHELEADLAKADVDLALIQAKIAARRGK